MDTEKLRRGLRVSAALALSLLALVSCASNPVRAPAASPTREDITAADLAIRVEILAHDSMLGRESGTIGNVRATAYIARELARMGALPAGEHETFFQSVPLFLRSPDTTSVLRSGASVLRYGYDLVPLRALSGAPFGRRFEGSRIGVVYGGELGKTLIPPSVAQGKLVVFAARLIDGRPAPQVLGVSGATFDAYREAAGVLISGLETLPGGALAFLQQPVMVSSASAARAGVLPAARITTAAAERLLGATLDGLAPGAPGSAVSGSFGLTDREPAFASRNVVALVRGRDSLLAAEFVAIGSHTDHVGTAPVALDHDSVFAFNRVLRRSGANEPARVPNVDQAARIREIRDSLRALRPARPDSIFNGADDDASAVAIALELVEYFARHPARRSLLFVFHTAEEKGLFGAEYFTDHPTVSRSAIVAQLNMDQVSRGGPQDITGAKPRTLYVLGSRRLSNALGDLVETTNRLPEHQFNLDYSIDAPGHPANGYCRSDHYMYARYGIPVVFLSAGWHPDYHMVTDEAAYVRVDVMLGVAGLVRDLARALGDADARPVRDGPVPDPRTPCRQ